MNKSLMLYQVFLDPPKSPLKRGVLGIYKCLKSQLKTFQTTSKVSRLTTIWADGGFDGPSFMMWVMDVCRWIEQEGATTTAN